MGQQEEGGRRGSLEIVSDQSQIERSCVESSNVKFSDLVLYFTMKDKYSIFKYERPSRNAFIPNLQEPPIPMMEGLKKILPEFT